MTLAWVLVAAVGAMVLILGVALRVRKLRLDEMRRLMKPTDRRLVTPPASPYEPSRGFRLLDATGEPAARPPLERPRLDPERHYAFNELSANVDEVVSSHVRHGDDWFLSRSSHRSAFFLVTRRLIVALLVILVVIVVATYYVGHHPSSAGHPTSTTTTSRVNSSLRPSSGTVVNRDASVALDVGHGFEESSATRGVAASHSSSWRSHAKIWASSRHAS